MRDRFGVVTLAGLLIAGNAFAGASVFAPPPGARVIDFEDDGAAPPYFLDTTALRDRYAPLGITFSGPGSDGGAILNDGTDFGVTGYSGHNFLAFNAPFSTLSDGGLPQFPETMVFRHPVRYVQFNIGDPAGSTVTIDAYDADDNHLGTNSLVTSGAIQTLSIEARQITRLVITYTGELAVIDDVAFVLDSTVIDFDDVAAPAGFANTTALRDRYAAKGVLFVGVTNEGGAILNETSNFGVSGYSPPNFLAFNQEVPMMDGGIPKFPQYVLFQPPVKHIEFLVGDPGGSTVTADVYDFNEQFLAESSVVAGATMKTLSIDAPSISTLKISSTSTSGVIDDLAFDVDGTVIDFDDAAGETPFFEETAALRDRYAALGVTFDGGGGPDDGAAILAEDGGFGVNLFSGENILAFNQLGNYPDGGLTGLPETVHFDRPMKRVEFRAGASSPARIDVEVFNAVGHSVGTSYIDMTPKLQSLILPAEGITKMVITTNGDFGAIDDLAFQPEDPCAHDACYAGTALVHSCDVCVETICDTNSDCCNDGWDTACAKSVDSLCGLPCAILCGDANDDRKLSASDALSALKTAVGSAMCPLVRCDFTGDGKVLSSDALGILRTAVGLMTTPKCPAEVI